MTLLLSVVLAQDTCLNGDVTSKLVYLGDWQLGSSRCSNEAIDHEPQFLPTSSSLCSLSRSLGSKRQEVEVEAAWKSQDIISGAF